MRKITILLSVLAVIFFAGNSYSQSGWQKLSQTATPSDLNEVKFINAQTGWACGEQGTLIKTTNGGANWTVIPTGMSVYVNTVHFVNALTGWIAYDVNTLKKTTDGGDTWATQVLSGSGTINRCWALNDQICFASGANGKLYKTTNGGTNWYVVHSGVPDYNRFSFPNNMTGWISGSNNIIRTTNGGDNWTVIPLTGANKDLCFLNNLTGWVASYPNVVKTTNGGDTWQSYTFADSVTIFDGVRFLNSQTGFVIGSYNSFYKGRIYKTTDGGVSWNKQRVYPDFGFYGLDFVNSLTGYAVGDGGMVYKTTTAGETLSGWIFHKTPATLQDLNEVRFINPLTGWACGGNGALIKTVDGGASWNAIYSATTSFVQSLYFINENTGWIADASSKILKTTNGGTNWTVQSNFAGGINRLHAFDDMNCLATGIDGKMFRTSNGGANWNMVYSNAIGLNRYCFVNNMTGWATGTNALYKTTDGGYNWVMTPLTGSNRDISFVNAQTGWIPNFPNMMKTTNGGDTWTTYNVTSEPGGYFWGTRFVNAQTGYCIGVDYTNGKIFKTTNGGVNWVSQTIPAVYGIYGLHFYDELTGWAVGSGGNTFRTVDGGLTFVSQLSSNTPDNYLLKQNYPNPFNPSTKINYEVKSASLVSLKVFDFLGKEVAQLVNEKQNPGIYAVDFSSSVYNLPSGVYFYTLTAGTFRETRKMVLIK